LTTHFTADKYIADTKKISHQAIHSTSTTSHKLAINYCISNSKEF